MVDFAESASIAVLPGVVRRMTRQIRIWLTGGALIGTGLSLVVASARGTGMRNRVAPPPPHSGISAAHHETGTATPGAYSAHVQPLIKKYCFDCHSKTAMKAGLNLERFADIGAIKKDIKTWQSVLDHLHVGDMPPREMPQPSVSEKKTIVDWVEAVLAADGKARAGDPGDVPLRRLSNAEYNATIKDLTGVDLEPAREFPADGAAGEGFTNAAESLTDVSPNLLTKYFDAAKEVASHAALLSDGFRFAPGKTRRDWTDASTVALRAFYTHWARPDGKLEFAPYLAATIRHRADLTAGRTTLDAVATQEKLNAKYLTALWKGLTDQTPSYPLDAIRADWRAAVDPVKDVPALSGSIAAWQAALWQVVRVGSYVHPIDKLFAESVTRQIPVTPIVTSQVPVRLAAKPEPGKPDILLCLTSRNLNFGGKNASHSVVWKRPRFEAPGKPTLLLKDYAQYGHDFEVDYPALFSSTDRYLNAVVEAVNSDSGSVDEVAKRSDLNPQLLARWIDLIALPPRQSGAAAEFPGRAFQAVNLELLTEQAHSSNNIAAINGWHSKHDELPALITNSSDRLEHIPGNAVPHSVQVHPTPSQFVGVTWTSPITGTVRVSGSIVHVHPSCGNGVAWWLEHRRGERAAMWNEGRIELGGSATPPDQSLRVEKGDVILLAIDAKDGDHSCDLTRVNLHIASIAPDTVWDLTSDIANTVLSGNPHADSHGNQGVWSFVQGPTRTVGAGTASASVIPADSVLGQWRAVAAEPRQSGAAADLARKTAALLEGPRPTEDAGNNRKLYDALVAADSVLLSGLDPATLPHLKSPPGNVAFGLSPSAFNGDGDLVTPLDTFTGINLPASLFAGRQFVTEAAIAGDISDREVLFQAGTRLTPNPVWDGKTPLVGSPKNPDALGSVKGFDAFRSLFPMYTCYPAVIPNDEIVSLKMFHREDEPLVRLFLDEAQHKQIDRLWDEHRFLSRQPAAENKYLPLFIGFVTQDQPKEMVAFFEGQRPAFQRRSDAFERDEIAAIPKQLDALTDFTSRAFRRPLTAREKAEQAELYRSLRVKGASHEEAFRGVIARVLVAPAFLFRIEQSPNGPKPAPVSDWELATRLSYFLWSTEPDETLRRCAAAGQLHNGTVLQSQVLRMLKDEHVRSLAVEFGAQWLHVRGFDQLNEKNEKLFPTFDVGLRKDIYEETVLFFQDLFQNDRPVTRVLDADYTYLNESLAKHYGIPGVSGAAWRRVEGVHKYGRGGVLGLATFQTMESGASRTSPILRGNWVSETLLGERLPRPPKNVPKLPEEESTDGLTIRQQVEMHSKNPACNVCHRRIDPFGFALERYDPIGRNREKDLSGRTLDDHAKLTDGTQFKGIDGLRNYLMTRRQDQVVHLFCRRLLGYALGRSVQNSDQPLIDAMVVELNRKHQMSAAVIAIVNSPQFRMRRGR